VGDLNAVVHDDGPEPVVTSTMVMVTGGAQPAVIGVARVTQTCHRMSDGWRIARRQIA
jgi:hypothetical protein